MAAEQGRRQAAGLRVLTLALDGVGEADIAPLLTVLDAEERRRAARFVFPANRVEFVAAHALTRAALAEALPGTAPAAFGFRPGPHGKPEALLGGRPAPVSFNLSHTDGMVGVAVAPSPGLRLGFDLEPVARRVGAEVARNVFRPEERAWLDAQPDEAAWRLAFLRLWTLKEAFIKATGRGIGQGLQTFWFQPAPAIDAPPRFHLLPRDPGPAEDPPPGDTGQAEDPLPGDTGQAEEWTFAQRLLPGGGFLGAVGLHRRPGDAPPRTEWTTTDLPALRAALGLA